MEMCNKVRKRMRSCLLMSLARSGKTNHRIVRDSWYGRSKFLSEDTVGGERWRIPCHYGDGLVPFTVVRFSVYDNPVLVLLQSLVDRLPQGGVATPTCGGGKHGSNDQCPSLGQAQNYQVAFRPCFVTSHVSRKSSEHLASERLQASGGKP